MPLFAGNEDTEKQDHTPVPYTKTEFPLWQRELRRFEILSFGALPFVTMLSFWGYDMIRAAKHPKDPGYYPWPLKSPDKAVPLTEKEQRTVFFTAVGLSIGVAVIDITYRAIKRAVEKKRLERQNLFADDPITFTPTALPIEDEPSAQTEAENEKTADAKTTENQESAQNTAKEAR